MTKDDAPRKKSRDLIPEPSGYAYSKRGGEPGGPITMEEAKAGLSRAIKGAKLQRGEKKQAE
jgi:hypothetical protein